MEERRKCWCEWRRQPWKALVSLSTLWGIGKNTQPSIFGWFSREEKKGKMWTNNQQKIMHIVEGKDKGKKCFSVLWNHDLELPICATGVQNVPL